MSYLRINTFNPATRPLSPLFSLSVSFYFLSLSFSHSFSLSLSFTLSLYLSFISFLLYLSIFVSLYSLSLFSLSLFLFFLFISVSSSHFFLFLFFLRLMLPVFVCLFLCAFSSSLMFVYLPVSLFTYNNMYIYNIYMYIFLSRSQKHTVFPALTMTGLLSFKKNILLNRLCSHFVVVFFCTDGDRFWGWFSLGFRTRIFTKKRAQINRNNAVTYYKRIILKSKLFSLSLTQENA